MASNAGDVSRDYDAAKTQLKSFLSQFHEINADTGRKDFVYATQITRIAHREQVHEDFTLVV
jgi:DNA replication licensing factor MCM7